MTEQYPDRRRAERDESEESPGRTVSVRIHRDLVSFMIDYCRARRVGLSTAMSEAMRSFLVEQIDGEAEDDEPTIPDGHAFELV